MGNINKHRPDIWGPEPQGRGTPAGDHFAPGAAVGTDTLGAAVGELHSQHPHHVQDDHPLQHLNYDKRHRPVTSATYGKNSG